MGATVDTSGLRLKQIIAAVEGPKLGNFAASEWHRLYAPYVPKASGVLCDTVDIRPWEIEHTAPYAHYMYEGKVYGPNIPITHGGRVVGWFSRPGQPKHPTGAAIQYSGRGCAKWDQVAMATQLPALVRSLQAFVDGGGLD